MKKSTIVIFVVTAALLMIPLVLTIMNISNGGVEGQGWYWRPGDFIVMGALMLGTGFAIRFATSKVKSTKHKMAIGAVIFLAFLAIWVHLAVGIVDTWPLAGS